MPKFEEVLFLLNIWKMVCQELVELELFGGRQHNNICSACDVLTIFRSEWLMVQAIMFMNYVYYQLNRSYQILLKLFFEHIALVVPSGIQYYWKII